MTYDITARAIAAVLVLASAPFQSATEAIADAATSTGAGQSR
jgi:hypothetical protein